MAQRLSVPMVAREAFAGLFGVVLAVVLANVLGDDRIQLLGGALVGLRMGWVRSSRMEAALAALATLIASWLIVLPNFVDITPTNWILGTGVVLGVGVAGLALGVGAQALIRRDPRRQPAPVNR